MFSDCNSLLPFLYNDVEVKLFHRENRGRSRILRIESDTGIKEDEILSIVNANGDYEVMCEFGGIKGKKPIKLRFHPHILEAGKQNEIIQGAIKRTTANMVTRFLSTEWTLESPESTNEDFIWKDVQELLLQQIPLIELTNDHRTVITWKVNSENFKLSSNKLPRGKKAKAMEKFFAKLEKCLNVHVSNVPTGQENGLPKMTEYFELLTKLSLSPPSQLVEVYFMENNVQKKLLTFEFAGFPPLDDMVTNSLHQFLFNPKFGTIQLDLIAKTDVKRCIWIIPQHIGILGYIQFNHHQQQTSKDGKLMIDCAHYRVQELPRDLSDSIDDYPKAMMLEPSSQPKAVEAKHIPMKRMSTPVEALFLSTNAVALKIEDNNSPPRRASLSSRFQVSPVFNAPPARKPSGPTSIKPLHVDAALSSLHVSTKNSMVASPSDSIDSGVISPGIVSDDDHHLHLRNNNNVNETTTPTNPRLKLRDRSASECFPDQSIIIPSYPGLKGILKKPKSFNSNSPLSNGLRRSPASTRMLFARSISECHDGIIENEMELDFLGESNDSTIASSSPPRCDRGFFRVEEEDESDSSDTVSNAAAAGQIHPLKKRVSFSEHVQARVYRSNSSILGQKKKNERRRRSNRKHSSDSESTLNGTDDDETSYSVSPSERAYLEELAKDFNNSDRFDSASPIMRSDRNLSTDSAFGDDENDDSDETKPTEKRLEMLSVA